MLAVETEGAGAEAVPPAAGAVSPPIIDVKPARANFELHENCSQSLCVSVSPPVLERRRRRRAAGGRARGGHGAPAGTPHARAPRRGAQTPRAGRAAGRARAGAGPPARPPRPRARRAHASHQAENSPAAVRLRAAGCERKGRPGLPRAAPPRPRAPTPGSKETFWRRPARGKYELKLPLTFANPPKVVTLV